MIKLLQLKNQTGRSMIEMLGVLAIVGVLSIAGISMYRRAINSHTANELVYGMSLLGVNIIEKDDIFFEEPCTFFEEGDIKVPSLFDTCTVTTEDNDSITIRVTYKTTVSQRVRNLIKDRCTKELHISTDATEFSFGPHGKVCSRDTSGTGVGGQPQEPEEEVPAHVCITYVEQDFADYSCDNMVY